jgi:signal transduction histidine kinase
MSVSLAPVVDQDSEVVGMVSVFRDFTHEAELDRMKNDFIAIASHELRTPLTSIRGYLDLLLMGVGGTLDQQQRDFLQIVKENTDRLHELANDLLDISRIESDRVELDVTVVSLSSLIREVAVLFVNQLQAKGLQLIVDIPDDYLRYLQIVFVWPRY